MSAPISGSYPPVPCSQPVGPDDFTVFAHRGASALAPENTLAAFRRAGAEGAAWVELDVDVIGDGTVVVIHDSSLDRTTNCHGSYYDLTAADLADVDAGSWFTTPDGARPYTGESLPTLQAALEVAGEAGMGVNVELKSCEAGAAACRRLVDGVDALLEAHAERWPSLPVMLSCFNPLLLDRMAKRRPGTPRALLTKDGLLLDTWRSYVEEIGAVAVNPANLTLERGRVEEIRSLGYGVNVWTVNTLERARELSSWGVTGIFTDRVHELGALGRGGGRSQAR
ncbi:MULTISPECIES: glycerophosphodiester phosphodiesterase family protein [Actinomyces]|uniref:Glycerophosphodiester phosphodiesterase n=1 Tax=Actinomyces respiraculi TaxID=2744574 RepID=A0A7T0LL27_9ACTO|nr:MULTISPECIES: glycerophosphodiester phosphodiesterase family protein [Actinomyces]QPL05597.1 glycerophosphodiester phosphodiesterase [Actinomyces respiraculi]